MISFSVIFFQSKSFAQVIGITVKDSIVTVVPAFKISGYVDAYYAYYTDSVGTGNYQRFPSVSPRSNTFGLNTALLTAQYDGEKVRGVVTLHYGDIPRSAWSPLFNPIMEAHVGFRLCKNNKLWMDAGLFRTHFGTEGLLPKENICSSIAVNTFYEPYFEGGIRLNYNPCDKLSIYVYALNGYNMFDDNNKKKSFGMLATYTMGDNRNIGYSNYIGDDTPSPADTISHLRIHNNLFFNYQVKKLKIQIGGDYCMQKNSDIATGTKTASMYSGVAGLKYNCCKLFSVYGRGEIFNDPEGMMSGIILDKTNKFTGYKLWGATLGVEYKPTENSYLRLEARQLEMDKNQEIFHWKNDPEDSRLEILFNMGISF
jgi:hypothetical protein